MKRLKWSLFLAKLTYNFTKRIFHHGCIRGNVAGFCMTDLKQPLFSSRFNIRYANFLGER